MSLPLKWPSWENSNRRNLPQGALTPLPWTRSLSQWIHKQDISMGRNKNGVESLFDLMLQDLLEKQKLIIRHQDNYIYFYLKGLFSISSLLTASITGLWVSSPECLMGHQGLGVTLSNVHLPVVYSNIVQQATDPLSQSRCLSHDKWVLRILHLLPIPTCTPKCRHQSSQDSRKQKLK